MEEWVKKREREGDCKEEASKKRKYYNDHPRLFWGYYNDNADTTIVHLSDEERSFICEDIWLYGSPRQKVEFIINPNMKPRMIVDPNMKDRNIVDPNMKDRCKEFYSLLEDLESKKKALESFLKGLDPNEVTKEEAKAILHLIPPSYSNCRMMMISEPKFFQALSDDRDFLVYLIVQYESRRLNVMKKLNAYGIKVSFDVLMEASTIRSYRKNLTWFLSEAQCFLDETNNSEEYWKLLVNLFGQYDILPPNANIEFVVKNFCKYIEHNDVLVEKWYYFLQRNTMTYCSLDELTIALRCIYQRHKQPLHDAADVDKSERRRSRPMRAFMIVLEYVYSEKNKNDAPTTSKFIEEITNIFSNCGKLKKHSFSRLMADFAIPTSTLAMIFTKGIVDTTKPSSNLSESPFMTAYITGRMDLVQLIGQVTNMRSALGDMNELFEHLSSDHTAYDDDTLELLSNGGFDTMMQLHNSAMEKKIDVGIHLTRLYQKMCCTQFPKTFQYLVDTYKDCAFLNIGGERFLEHMECDTLIYIMRNDLHDYDCDFDTMWEFMSLSDLLHIEKYSEKCCSMNNNLPSDFVEKKLEKTKRPDISESWCTNCTCDCLERLQLDYGVKFYCNKIVNPNEVLNLLVKHPIVADKTRIYSIPSYNFEMFDSDSGSDAGDFGYVFERLHRYKEHAHILAKYKRFSNLCIKSNTPGMEPSVATWIINGFVDYVLARKMPITIDDLVELVTCPSLLLNLEAKESKDEDKEDLEAKESKDETKESKDEDKESDDEDKESKDEDKESEDDGNEDDYEDEEAMPKYWLKRLHDSGVDFSQSTSQVKMFKHFSEKYDTLLDVAKAFHDIDHTETIVPFLESLQ